MTAAYVEYIKECKSDKSLSVAISTNEAFVTAETIVKTPNLKDFFKFAKQLYINAHKNYAVTFEAYPKLTVLALSCDAIVFASVVKALRDHKIDAAALEAEIAKKAADEKTKTDAEAQALAQAKAAAQNIEDEKRNEETRRLLKEAAELETANPSADVPVQAPVVANPPAAVPVKALVIPKLPTLKEAKKSLANATELLNAAQENVKRRQTQSAKKRTGANGDDPQKRDYTVTDAEKLNNAKTNLEKQQQQVKTAQETLNACIAAEKAKKTAKK